ncbi:MAG TPA: hypothetical protein PKI93_06905 [Alphaproteobacteria bacterium]|nr:hypothetical protein [Alphaproteobacteria bacterium]HNS43700.1 hypothetical protein [Alphaproteobacteria bacterium]
MRHWTPEERARQSAAIRKWKPWTSSTGPRTAQGKSRSALNATKHGFRSRAGIEFFSLLTRHRAFLRAVETRIRMERLQKKKNTPNELLKGHPAKRANFPDLADKTWYISGNLVPNAPPEP